jgi:hypothetical protein
METLRRSLSEHDYTHCIHIGNLFSGNIDLLVDRMNENDLNSLDEQVKKVYTLFYSVETNFAVNIPIACNIDLFIS